MITVTQDRRRHFGLDWLRIAAFAVLILYHIGLYFGPWGWHVEPMRTEPWLVFPLLATAPWRMALLFAVSGYASAQMLSRGAPATFLKERSWRLLLPLAFAMLVINPPQGWVEARIGGNEDPYVYWWLTEQLHLPPGGNNAPTLSHMWFVAYVWIYAVLLATWRALPDKATGAVRSACVDLLQGWGMMLVPLTWLLLVEVVLWPGHRPRNVPADDGLGHAIYLSAFAFGALLAEAPTLWASLRRLRWLAVTAAIAGYALIVWNDQFAAAPAIGAAAATTTTDIGHALMIWGAVAALLAFADLWLNRDHPWRAPLTQAVFPFYIIHQTIVVLIGYWLRPLDLPTIVAFPVVLGATVAGSILFWYFGRMIPSLRPLIGLPRHLSPANTRPTN